MAVNSVYRISVLGTLLGEPVINTFAYRVAVVGAGSEMDNLQSAFSATLSTPYGVVLSSAYAGVSIIVQGVLPVTPLKVYSAIFSNGSAPAACLPSQIAVIITKKTSQPGKGGRGRLFVPGVPQAWQLNDTINPANMGNYNNLATVVAQVLTTGGWTFNPCLYKRKFGTSLDLTTATAGSALRTRRSRAFNTRFHRRKKHTVGSI